MPPRFTRRWPFSGGWIRQSTALVLLVISLVTAAGVPIPTPPSPNSAASERFPCERCPCGCATADYCWRKCCCHSLQERLAWAKHEGVRPPEFALADAARQGLDTTAWNDSESSSAPKHIAMTINKSSCCQREGAAKSCCAKNAVGSPAACCAGNHADESAPPRSSPGIVVIRALACQGLAAGWLTIPPTIPPVAPMDSPGLDLSPAGCVAIIAVEFDGSSLPPPVPPPELLTVCS